MPKYYEAFGYVIQQQLYPQVGDVVVWLSLDDETIVTLYCFDSEEAEWYWETDWYEGQENVSLIDFCLVEDTRPRKRAHWIKVHNPNYSPFDSSVEFIFYCSHCNKVFGEDGNFCPRCGYEMVDLVYESIEHDLIPGRLEPGFERRKTNE